MPRRAKPHRKHLGEKRKCKDHRPGKNQRIAVKPLSLHTRPVCVPGHFKSRLADDFGKALRTGVSRRIADIDTLQRQIDIRFGHARLGIKRTLHCGGTAGTRHAANRQPQ